MKETEVLRSHVSQQLAVVLGALAIQLTMQTNANAVKIQLNDVASDRIERQRDHAAGKRELPGMPDTGKLEQRLTAAGLKLGLPVFVRIFKEESQVELWMKKDDRFRLFATYPICNWSGTLGPKIKEGDRQNPEGFYTITRRQLHRSGRWPKSLNIGFPNAFDRALKRTGSYILIHGGCTSVGCYAMTDKSVHEIFHLANHALRTGQPQVHVHAFPFHMTAANLDRYKSSMWFGFWKDLKEGYDAFAATGIPPRVARCHNRYMIEAAAEYEQSATAGLKKRKRRSKRWRSSLFPPSKACKPAPSFHNVKSSPEKTPTVTP